MKAHALFDICKNSIVDSAADTELDTDKLTLFSLDWKQLCRVMEMELSLMYDFLYTKAYVIHTWRGYCIRFISPVFTAVSLVLVELSNKSGRHLRSDVVITRVLLVATIVLETASLVKSLGSTWTNFFSAKNKTIFFARPDHLKQRSCLLLQPSFEPPNRRTSPPTAAADYTFPRQPEKVQPYLNSPQHYLLYDPRVMFWVFWVVASSGDL
ncbi:hypothetical protein GUJ93_ZPchr0004g40158 [Zizania palustris]|uniref:DUF4220 domain-containing protein n=1 Tax=Zizania palustris TaxID=103762 RepID=A0A8J5SY14_ZIZPA|nr:hypothetical protein GUJ93_ZPchr0004g40158 [Zizania palustris]